MFDILTQNIILSWLVVGCICILFEAMAIPGVGLLFAGFAALTVGGLLQFGVLGLDQYTIQAAVFLGASFVWAAVLWVPLQQFHKKNKKEAYSNMVGDVAVVCNGPLLKNQRGEVKWSGTVMHAMLAENSTDIKLDDDTTVKIVAVDGNILKVLKN